jgi:hypothetical protein
VLDEKSILLASEHFPVTGLTKKRGNHIGIRLTLELPLQELLKQMVVAKPTVFGIH